MIETLLVKIQNQKARIFTRLIKGSFKSFGSDSYIFAYPLKLKGLNKISVGTRTSISKGAQITTWENGTIVIGDNCRFNANCHITSVNSIDIGNNFFAGTNVLITDNSHGEFSYDQLNMAVTMRPIFSKGPVVIGNNVWLGNNVCVMPGVTIGDGVIVGANSVVTHDIPSYCMAAGIPAKIIRRIY